MPFPTVVEPAPPPRDACLARAVRVRAPSSTGPAVRRIVD